MSVLRVPILVVLLLACDGRGTPSTREARSGEFLGSDLDNQGLVQGRAWQSCCRAFCRA